MWAQTQKACSLSSLSCDNDNNDDGDIINMMDHKHSLLQSFIPLTFIECPSVLGSVLNLGIQRLLRQRLFLWKAHGLEGNDNNNSSKIRQSDVVWSSLWEVWGKIPYFQKKPVLKSAWESWARFTEKGKHEWESLGYEQGRAFHRAGIAGHGVWSSEWCLELHFLCRAGRCAAREGGRPHTPCGLLRLGAAASQP